MSFFDAKTGDLWLGGMNGINRIDTNTLTKKDESSSLYLTSLKINGEKVQVKNDETTSPLKENIISAQQWMSEQGEKIEKSLYNDPDFAKTYEADKKYAKENNEEFVQMRDREIVAVIAYLQRLGTDIKVTNGDGTTENLNE